MSPRAKAEELDQEPEVAQEPEKELTPDETPPEEKREEPDFDPKALAEEVKKLRKDLGKRDEELGSLRNDLGYYERLMQQQAARTMNQQQPQAQEPEANFDYENPAKSAREIARAEIQAYQSQIQQTQAKKEAAEAYSKFQRGYGYAKKQNPKLFDGLDKEIQDTAYYAYRAGQVAPWKLDDPETYVQLAQAARLTRGQYEFLVPPKPAPGMTAPETDTPRRRASEEPDEEYEDLNVDPFTEELLEHRPKGMTKKQFLDKVQQERKKGI